MGWILFLKKILTISWSRLLFLFTGILIRVIKKFLRIFTQKVEKYQINNIRCSYCNFLVVVLQMIANFMNSGWKSRQLQSLCLWDCTIIRAATAGKAPKAWAMPRFLVSIRSYKKQPVKNIWGRILGLAWLKFAVAALCSVVCFF